jgi:hypothetical protein
MHRRMLLSNAFVFVYGDVLRSNTCNMLRCYYSKSTGLVALHNSSNQLTRFEIRLRKGVSKLWLSTREI